VSTGLEIECYVPFSFVITFEGYRNTCGLEAFSKYVIPFGDELFVTIQNLSLYERIIKKGMPLGRIMIQYNQ
jgi:hypothetical protein